MSSRELLWKYFPTEYGWFGECVSSGLRIKWRALNDDIYTMRKQEDISALMNRGYIRRTRFLELSKQLSVSARQAYSSGQDEAPRTSLGPAPLDGDSSSGSSKTWQSLRSRTTLSDKPTGNIIRYYSQNYTHFHHFYEFLLNDTICQFEKCEIKIYCWVKIIIIYC